MKLITLASSSKGNSVLVFTDNTKILVDMGICLEELELKLNILHIDPKDITAILNTHEHGDHTKGIGAFMRKYQNCKLYCHTDGYSALLKKIGRLDQTRICQFTELPFNVGDFEIKAFKLPHDAQSCVGYNIKQQDKIISIATDFGHTTDEIINNLINSRLVVLEANHDEQMLLDNPKYSYMLKNRILGKNGHLSNITTAKVIVKLAQCGVKQVVLAHLSEENNTPSLCYKTITDYLKEKGIVEGIHIKIDIAKPHELGTLFSLT